MIRDSWPRRRPLSRRRLLHRTALGGSGIAALFLAACGGDDDSSSTQEAGRAGSAATAGAQSRQPGGELNLAQGGNPPNLDPQLTTAGNTTNLGRMVYSQVA